MLQLVKEAAERLKDVAQRTPIVFSSSLSKLLGYECHMKLENFQKTGSFKIRGAYNRMACLTDEEKAKGVVTASSGNHAQAVACSATMLGMKSFIVMPETTPIIKYTAARTYGGEVIFHGSSFEEANEAALMIARERGKIYIAPFDDELVMAGQGTIGLEIREDLRTADAIVVPVGGGGLIAGIAASVKILHRDVRIIGVVAESSRSALDSLRSGERRKFPCLPTIADGVAVGKVGEKTFPLIKKYVDDIVTVDEDGIASAILQLIERKKLVVEGAGALPMAAALEGKLPAKIKKAVFVVSGGNIDVTMLDRVLRMGLSKEGRITRLTTLIRDVPGALAEFTAELSKNRANILHINHQRDAMDVPMGLTRIEVILEVEGADHTKSIVTALSDKGYPELRRSGQLS